jgi:hypothetical protein
MEHRHVEEQRKYLAATRIQVLDGNTSARERRRMHPLVYRLVTAKFMLGAGRAPRLDRLAEKR